MQVLKKLALSVLMVGLSANVFAVEVTAATAEKIAAAAAGTIEKIQEAVNLADQKGNKEEIVKLINDARQLQKEFRYEITERQRQKSNDRLRIARDSFESGDIATAETKLKEALAGFTEMKATYDSNH